MRKEVNFGCPVTDCGSPYLHYHHFDPSWKEKEHHNPEGMIALCKEHHPVADSGAWTKEQLREMKSHPFLTNNLVGRFDWLRRDILVMAGGISYNPKVILEIRNEKTVWMQKDSEGYYRLNMLIRDSEGSIVLEIIDNDWVSYNEKLADLICPPSGKHLTLNSKDKLTNLAIRFDDVPIETFGKRLSSIWAKNNEARKIFLKNPEQEKEEFVNTIIKTIGNPQRVTTCTINASLEYRGSRFKIKDGIISSGSVKIYVGFASEIGTLYRWS